MKTKTTKQKPEPPAEGARAVVWPRAAKSRAAKPRAAKPRAASAQATAPRVTEPRVTEPQRGESRLAAPARVKPQAPRSRRVAASKPRLRLVKSAPDRARSSVVLVVSVGCPAGIGPEVSLAAALARSKRRAKAGDPSEPCVLVGDLKTLQIAAGLLGVGARCLVPFDLSRDGAPRPLRGAVYVYDPGARVAARDRKPGKPTVSSGAAQLAWVEAAYQLCKQINQQEHIRAALVTGPVSKHAIATSGVPGAEAFLGHTEWLQALDGAATSVMCFAAKQLTTSLVSTHFPLSAVPEQIRAETVEAAIVALVELLRALGNAAPKVAVCSLNPHAGEGELLGAEERTAIVPGIERARRALAAAGGATGRQSVLPKPSRGAKATPGAAQILGPIGAETAFRKAMSKVYDGVVAMYHDQATIPMKLVAFGEAVNVTAGLSVVRTSVDHGTGYDIAWRGAADSAGMLAALDLAAALVRARG